MTQHENEENAPLAFVHPLELEDLNGGEFSEERYDEFYEIYRSSGYDAALANDREKYGVLSVAYLPGEE